jgi:hypothetical protein
MNTNLNLPYCVVALIVNLWLPSAWAQADSKPYNPDFGNPSILHKILPEPKATVNQTYPDKFVMVSALKATGKLSDSKDLVIFAHPGKNFRVELTVSFKVSSPTKLAANLLLEEAKFLKPDQISELKRHHNTTWHFDSETRQGFKSADGEGILTFDLTGLAPTEEGEYDFNLNIGLFDKKSFSTQALKIYPVKLVTKSSEIVTKDTLFSWISKDGKEVNAKFLKVDNEAVVIDKNGTSFTVNFDKLSPESIALANELAVSFDPQLEATILESTLKKAKTSVEESLPKKFSGNVYRTILGKWNWIGDKAKTTIQFNDGGTAQMDGETLRWSLSSQGPVFISNSQGRGASVTLESKSSFSGTDFDGKPISGTKSK